MLKQPLTMGPTVKPQPPTMDPPVKPPPPTNEATQCKPPLTEKQAPCQAAFCQSAPLMQEAAGGIQPADAGEWSPPPPPQIPEPKHVRRKVPEGWLQVVAKAQPPTLRSAKAAPK